MSNLIRFFVRLSAFLGKELVEVLRQTPLILTFVLGPFLIMLLFGIGYRPEARPLRTLFVLSDNPTLRQEVEAYSTSLGPQLIYEGITSDLKAAKNSLRRNEVDLVVNISSDALQNIHNNQPAVIELYHNEIDPYQAKYIQYFGDACVDEINRRLLYSYIEQGQGKSTSIQENVQAARLSTQNMRQALEQGDKLAAENEKQKLEGNLDTLALLGEGSLGLLGGLDPSLDGADGVANPGQQSAISAALSNINQNRAALSELRYDQASIESEINKLEEMEKDLTSLETELGDFKSLNPNIIVAPFSSETKSVENITITPENFLAPGVIVMLLQHLAVTFAALAIVREQRSGTMELLRISPLSAFETLAGKYLSYLIFGGLMAAVVTVAMFLALRVPLQGAWQDYALVILVFLFTSLGMGFLISLVAKTDMQAVQYAMFLLLGSIFFSGFFVDLRYLWEPIRQLSWALPATYGIRLLQDIMFRGVTIAPQLFFPLLGIGAGLFLISLMLLRRRLQYEWS